MAVNRAAHLNHGASLLALSERLAGAPAITPEYVAETVTAIFGQQPAAISTSQSFRDDATRLRDTLLANYLLVRAPAASKELTTAMHMIGVIEAAAGEVDQQRLETILRRPLLLPDIVERLRDPLPQPAPQPSRAQQAETLRRDIGELAARAETLRRIQADLALHEADELVVREGSEERPFAELFVAQESEQRGETLGSSMVARAAARHNVFLARTAIERLPDSTMQTLREAGADPRRRALEEINQVISGQLITIRDELLKKNNQLGPIAAIEYDTEGIILEPGWLNAPIFDPVDDPQTQDPPWSPAVPQVPATHGTAKPIGLADLLVVKNQLVRYERGEVACIENVIGGERLTHTVRTAHTQEVMLTSESEQIDLRTEAETVFTAETGRSQAVAHGYGPVVEGSGAQTFATNLTDQTTSNLTSRMRQLTSRRTLTEREDKAEHVVDNTGAAGPRFGVYQWLHKVYQAQIFNYGQRLLYDVVVPEPAALFLLGMSLRQTNVVPIVRPAPFKLKPTDLNAANWDYYVAGHQATGVQPPPAPEIVVSVPFGGRASNKYNEDRNVASFIIGEARAVQIPRGYSAVKCRVHVRSELSPAVGEQSAGQGRLRVTVGKAIVNHQNALVERYLDGETETIPVTVLADTVGAERGFSTVTVGVEIVCRATPEGMAAWQSNAHAAILEANRRRFREYEERTANRDASLRLLLQNLAPDRKQSIVATELKRGALSVLTNQDFSGFNAIATDGFGLPQPSVFAVDQLSAYIRFFEQAFEWDRLSYLFYPYFWGRKKTWIEKLVTDEPDQRFAGFLQAGAARVILPVRPRYEGAIEHFMNSPNGEIPTLDKLLDVRSRLFVALVDLLRGDQDGTETTVGEPWEFRIPTALLRLRGDQALPLWVLEQGEWKQKPDPAFA
jgi:hypothetical protein